ncbi:hypothetical protein KQI86_15530 [Clostridium sp. MSJ-11]|uniref:Uncharacterized protein n=1 Tax=Clostridium mobile TaxID=2841512 RepID=A0ABS6EKJ1_9CLOT|nr:hypothetical protein [Clostridium mobile]MBU5485731.1 hypothetical protein [Clostridium mobile]
MNYIWINPVVKSMYGIKFENLLQELKRKDYEVVEPPSQIDVVKNKFKTLCSEKEDKIILDTRCPAAIEYIEDKINHSKFCIPKIEPILIHTARSLYDLYIKGDENNRLFITTPCNCLKDMGNNIFKKEGKTGVVFETWNDICENLHIKKEDRCSESPIPLGFFRDLNLDVLELSGEEEILKEVENIEKTKEKVNLIEMLLCEGGCNRGDGV